DPTGRGVFLVQNDQDRQFHGRESRTPQNFFIVFGGKSKGLSCCPAMRGNLETAADAADPWLVSPGSLRRSACRPPSWFPWRSVAAARFSPAAGRPKGRPRATADCLLARRAGRRRRRSPTSSR